MISKEIIEDIKFRMPIEDVVSTYVRLRRGGSTLKGLCPFHSEKTPSFTVFPSTQNFYCFGCGASGDVISFIMKEENLEYPDAIRFLAAKCGVTVPDDDRPSSPDVVTRKRILEINKCAAKYFWDCLNDNELGRPGREYLRDRQLSSSTVRHFGIGYSPNSFSSLHVHLNKSGFSDREIVAANLGTISSKNGKVYDFFRGRVMFPIIDVSGNVVAFGGRVIDGSEPKYLNSSDTPAFKKSRHLFALNFARQHCQEQLILCEGYMDVISLHAAGFENAVATLGTAITPEHARIFKKYSPKCIISYDADQAGQRAAERAFQLLGDAGVDARLLKVYDAKDPDEFIKKHGAAAFRKLLDDSKPRFEFKIDTVKAKYNLNDPDDVNRAINELCAFVATVYSPVQRELYVDRIAKEFNVKKNNVLTEVESIAKRHARENKKNEASNLIMKTSGVGDRVNPDYARMPKYAKLEETVLGLMLFHNEYLETALKEGLLTEKHFQTGFNRRLFVFMKEEQERDGFEFGLLNASFSSEEISRVSYMMLQRQRLADNSESVFRQSVASLLEEYEKGVTAKEGSLEALIDSCETRKTKILRSQKGTRYERK